MRMELDLESVYYFVWSLVVIMFLCKVCALLERLPHSIENLLHAVRVSKYAEATAAAATP